MGTLSEQAIEDRFATLAGRRLRYIEAGAGPPVLLIHGASLGSSAEVYRQTVRDLAEAGFRAIAYDQPGFGLSDPPAEGAVDPRDIHVPEVMAALGIERAALIGHSRSGGLAVELALKAPERYTHLVVLGTGSLLPPLDGASSEREVAEQRQQESGQSLHEPTLDETRALLEGDLYNHDRITPEMLERRHAFSIGRNFASFAARTATGVSNKASKPGGQPPLRERLGDLRVPLLMIYGRQDRARAGERAELLKRQRPELDVRIVENCKHLVPVDAAGQVAGIVIPFLKGNS
jgi:pimeloyl-ACP methyl ester carboxylesterase